MSKYDELPVYKASYDLLLEIFRFTKNFTKEYKYTIGESLKKETVELITLIYRANSKKNKFDILQAARDHKPTLEEQEQFLCSMKSNLGIMKHYKSYNLRKKLSFRYVSAWWWNYIYLCGGIKKFVLKNKSNYSPF